MELFDLVDEDDNVIGVTDKQTAHTNGHVHRVIAIYVFDKDGRLYLQDHIKSGLIDHSVGGHVDQGEDYDTAAEREGQEELGLIDPLTHLTIFFSNEDSRGIPIKHMFGVYECFISDDWRFEENEEVKNIFPMHLGEVIDWMNKEPEKFTPGFLNTMKEYIKHKNLPYKLHV